MLKEQFDSKSSKASTDEGTIATTFNNDVGGALRGILKTAIKRSKVLGKLTKRAIGLEKITESNYKTISKDKNESRQSKLRLYSKIAITTVPEFTKSLILGTILFKIYGNHTSNAHTSFHPNTYLNSCVVGTVAGGCNGCLSIMWDTSQAKFCNLFDDSMPLKKRILQPLVLPPSISSTLFVHSVVNGILFSSYEISKTITYPFFFGMNNTVNHRQASAHAKQQFDGMKELRIPKKKLEYTKEFENVQIIKFLTILVSGGVSGVISMTASYYIKPLERHGWKTGMSVMRRKILPPPRLLFSSIVPTAAGFVAFEHGREIIFS